MKKSINKLTKHPKKEQKDIMTEMFKHFGIEVVEVNYKIPLTKQKKKRQKLPGQL